MSTKQLNNRIVKLEKKVIGPALLVVLDTHESSNYQAEGKEYPSLEAVKEAYPERDITVLEIVYPDVPV